MSTVHSRNRPTFESRHGRFCGGVTAPAYGQGGGGGSSGTVSDRDDSGMFRQNVHRPFRVRPIALFLDFIEPTVHGINDTPVHLGRPNQDFSLRRAQELCSFQYPLSGVPSTVGNGL